MVGYYLLAYRNQNVQNYFLVGEDANKVGCHGKTLAELLDPLIPKVDIDDISIKIPEDLFKEVTEKYTPGEDIHRIEPKEFQELIN